MIKEFVSLWADIDVLIFPPEFPCGLLSIFSATLVRISFISSADAYFKYLTFKLFDSLTSLSKSNAMDFIFVVTS